MIRSSAFSSTRILAFSGLLAVGGQAQAAGFQITEQSVTGLGRAFAGSGVAADDASVIFYNPASMTLLPGYQAQAGLSYISGSSAFSNRGSFQTLPSAAGPVTVPSSGPGSDGGEDSLVPNLYFAMDLTERIKLGLGVVAPFGLRTDYDRNWVGRFHALESELATIDINPSIAYRLTDKLSIGAGFSAQYADATLSRAVFTGVGSPDGFVEVTGDDWSFGYNVGVMYAFDPGTRVGVSFRSKVSHTLKGERTLTGVGPRSGTVGAEASVDLPETVYLDGYQRLTDRWSVMAGARWTNWSRFDELRIRFADGSPDDVTPQNWKDTWTLSLGVSYDYSLQWTFRAGYAFDESPVPSSEFRTPRIPDSDRHWLALGVSYRPSPRLSVDFGYAHLFFDDSRLENTIPIAQTPAGPVFDTLVGEYNSSDADIFGIQLRYTF